MASRDYGPLHETQQRLAEEERQREEAARQREAAEQQERDQKGYHLLHETHERLEHERTTQEQFARQALDVTAVNYSQETLDPMRVDGVEPTAERVEAQRVHAMGDMHPTPGGTMMTYHNRPSAEREVAETDRAAELGSSGREVSDRRAEMTDHDQERAKVADAFDQFLARQREEQERERDEGREL